MSTLKEAKANEKLVCSLLNQYYDCEFKMESHKFSVNDLKGTINGERSYVEVKQRRELFDTFWIEPSKCLSIKEKGKRKRVKHYYYVCSVGKDHYMYDLKKVWNDGIRIKRMMNNYTAEDIKGSGEKIEKTVIQFDSASYMIKLGTTELGKEYEAIPEEKEINYW